MQFSSVLKKTHRHYERYVAPVAFIVGFVVDNLTLKRVDLWIDNLVLLAYLTLAVVGIAVVNAYESGRLRRWISEDVGALLPVLIQFPVGGLFSAFVVFYSRSGAFAASWPFLFMLLLLFVGNELFQTRYRRFTFHISIYFVTLFSYAILIMPVLFQRMGPDIFLVGGAASLVAIALVVLVLVTFAGGHVRTAMRPVVISILCIYGAFNILYFANIIPPIPLALKEGGVYHLVTRVDGGAYRVVYEPAPWYAPFQETSSVFHWAPGEPVYIFSAVFAPTALDTTIIHMWSYYDEKEGGWIQKDTFQFPIIGGRDGGYRGYSLKYDVRPGKWRVDVETARGQIIGRVAFTVVGAGSSLPLQTATR